MPCRDDGWPENNSAYEVTRDRLNRREAMLCAVLRTIEAMPTQGSSPAENLMEFLDQVDWREAGVRKHQLVQWWEQHKEKDNARLAAEAKKRERARLKAEAEAKAKALLTPEERKILGIE